MGRVAEVPGAGPDVPVAAGELGVPLLLGTCPDWGATTPVGHT